MFRAIVALTFIFALIFLYKPELQQRKPVLIAHVLFFCDPRAKFYFGVCYIGCLFGSCVEQYSVSVAVVVLVIDQTFSSLTCSNLGFHHERAQGNLLSRKFLISKPVFHSLKHS